MLFCHRLFARNGTPRESQKAGEDGRRQVGGSFQGCYALSSHTTSKS